jgi:hypothetical protein
MLTNIFKKHPRSIGETYVQHLRHSMYFSATMIAGGLLCSVHAILPFLFVNSGSRTITHLHDRMVVNRRSQSRAAVERS